ncbi:zinc finger CCCH domain-containing protein 24-like [Zingiber officinale]|uniref:zinc finger CCCH domain-containing protein 24-like n=1 Tax=Zingiber officinale TaxID=94328 RepID=UPI001C4B62F2|nr:zinc finger CCCH domain-containing protein 24-like [Zingiber officinale]
MASMEMTALAASPSDELEQASTEPTVAGTVNDALDIDGVGGKRKRDEEAEEKGGEEESARDAGDREPYWKTSLCSFYRRKSGREGCSHGDSCRYAHGEAELRPRPDKTWDPTSERAKKILRDGNDGNEDSLAPEVQGMAVDLTSLDKCLIGLPRKWSSDNLKSFLDGQGILCKTAKKKKGMSVGFVTFDNTEQLKRAIEVLNENTTSGQKQIKVADANRRSYQMKVEKQIPPNQNKGQVVNGELCTNYTMPSYSFEADDSVGKDTTIGEGFASVTKTARDVVTPSADIPYSDQLEQKMKTLTQTLKKLTRNARKACPPSVSLPEWIMKSREAGGLPCKLEGILESPLTNGYRNKCEFSVGYSLHGKPTVGFMVGSFREGITAIEEPINCPNVSRISYEFALAFQEFLQSSALPVWNRIENKGFWRQFTVREGRKSSQVTTNKVAEIEIAEVMLIIQVCSTDVDEEVMKNDFQRMVQTLVLGAAACSPPLPLTVIVVQDYQGISNAAPADCPLIPLMIPKVEPIPSDDKHAIEARIHDYISNLCFSISPTAFFQVNTLAAERLYSLAGDWADLNRDTLLFDICCGTGTIGLTLAHRVGMVVGIEMNASAVSDAQRNAMINGITNCRFVCSKAEDIMGALLKEYLDVPEHNGSISGISCKGVEGSVEEKIKDDSVASEGPDEDLNDSSEGNCSTDHSDLTRNDQVCKTMNLHICTSKDKDGADIPQFKNVVAIVDPPRVGLHPVVIKSLRTHPRIRRLVYISCNPESLVANAIELCTPTADEPEKAKGNRGWRKMSSAGLARHRTKSMPKSEPFRPVRVMAVDMFPHTPHCEMVMLLER